MRGTAATAARRCCVGRAWPRDAYTRAVWASDLTTAQRIIALAYADHASSGDMAWIPLPRLARLTGLARSTAAKHLAALAATGWLEVAESARQHRATRYRLTIPRSPGTGPLDEAQQSGSRTSGAQSSSPALDSSSPALDLSSPAPGPEYSEDCSEEAAAAPAAAVRDLDDILAGIGREAS